MTEVKLVPRTYLTLDGLRGIAAVCVMLYHYSGFLSARTVLPSSFLAVDLFFLLSGFVIAHAYEAKLLAGMSLLRFSVVRVVRLYPLYLAGLAIGVSYALLKNMMTPADATPVNGFNILLSAMFLPSPGTLFPFNPASWSLFFELAINFAYAVCIKRLSNSVLLGVLVLSFIALVVAGVHWGSLDIGMTPRTFWGGAARVCFSFTAGVLLWRRRSELGARVSGLAAISLAAAFAVFAVAPPSPAYVYDLACVAVLFPALVAYGARTEPSASMRPAFAWGARLSYPIYVLHGPVLMVAAGAYKVALHDDPAAAAPLTGLCFAGVTVAAAYATLRLFDEPLRARLNAGIRSLSPARAPVRP
uniref:Acyltransferase 3 n=1 Tax=Caulobacter sp. (strain K31) TaxID=366602 RepID=B0T117_CAUSK